MKKLDLNQMEMTEGEGFTRQEMGDFLGAASCVGVFFGGPLILFAAGSCIYWITGG